MSVNFARCLLTLFNCLFHGGSGPDMQERVFYIGTNYPEDLAVFRRHLSASRITEETIWLIAAKFGQMPSILNADGHR